MTKAFGGCKNPWDILKDGQRLSLIRVVRGKTQVITSLCCTRHMIAVRADKCMQHCSDKTVLLVLHQISSFLVNL